MYTFKNTEQNNKKATDLETKSLLYLIGMHKERQTIETIAVDCFNDVTGIDAQNIKLWDVQSKNHSVLNPQKIGKALFTLIDNFECPIDFHEYILFVPKLKSSYLINNQLHSYGISNIQPKTRTRIENGLKKEYKRVKKTDLSKTTLTSFLEEAVFVHDSKRTSTYIKELTKFKSNRIKSEEFYLSIFKEIKGVQANLKNSYIEGKTIKSIGDVLTFNRHIKTQEIHTLIINRFVGGDLFDSRNTPNTFLEVLDTRKDLQDKLDLIQECNSNVSRSFFDKNNNKRLWRLIERIIESLNDNPKQNLNSIYNYTEDIATSLPFMDKESTLFLISIILNGWNNEN
jgi:hypothetical protein